MQGSWNGSRAHYRCRYPAEYAVASRTEHPKNAYVREDAIVPPLDAWLAGAFDAEHLDGTVDTLLAPDEADLHQARAQAARRTLADCEQRLATYRSALEAGADLRVVARWTKETEEQRRAAEHELRQALIAERRQPSRKELEALIRDAGDLVGVLASAAVEDKAQLDARLGLRLSYQTGQAAGHRGGAARRGLWAKFVSAARCRPDAARSCCGASWSCSNGVQSADEFSSATGSERNSDPQAPHCDDRACRQVVANLCKV